MWSGGKDGALALLRTRAAGVPVTTLVNLYDPASERVRFHATRRELIQAQAASLGLELRQHAVPWERYDVLFTEALAELRRDGFTGVVFGDIHLADVRAWFESRVRAASLQHVEPVWGEDPRMLLDEFVRSGCRAIVTCVELPKLDREWLGRTIDETFAHDIAGMAVDAAGENGEYHSFVFDGPVFATPVRFSRGDTRVQGRFAQLDLDPVLVP